MSEHAEEHGTLEAGGADTIHLAGEQCSLYHAWIQGALESGVRAALEVHAPAS